MRNREASNHRIIGALHRWAATGQYETVERANAPAGVFEEPSRGFLDEPIEEAKAQDDPAENFGAEQHARQEQQPPHAEPDFLHRMQNVDWYEVLQISRNADQETIQRVYRIMAARFHPDNPKTGDVERFLLMTRAQQVLLDAVRRAEYDRMLQESPGEPMDVFEQGDILDGVEGEKNRRLGILSLLYHGRRLNDVRPGLALLDLEQRMALPREYLAFTLWYLQAKGYVHCEENSDYSITAPGIDYLETQYSNRVVRHLLNPGASSEGLSNEA